MIIKNICYFLKRNNKRIIISMSSLDIKLSGTGDVSVIKDNIKSNFIEMEQIFQIIKMFQDEYRDSTGSIQLLIEQTYVELKDAEQTSEEGCRSCKQFIRYNQCKYQLLKGKILRLWQLPPSR